MSSKGSGSTYIQEHVTNIGYFPLVAEFQLEVGSSQKIFSQSSLRATWTRATGRAAA